MWRNLFKIEKSKLEWEARSLPRSPILPLPHHPQCFLLLEDISRGDDGLILDYQTKCPPSHPLYMQKINRFLWTISLRREAELHSLGGNTPPTFSLGSPSISAPTIIYIISSDSDGSLLYIYLYIQPLNPIVQIFTQSIDAIDVTSVTQSRLTIGRLVNWSIGWMSNVKCQKSNVKVKLLLGRTSEVPPVIF